MTAIITIDVRKEIDELRYSFTFARAPATANASNAINRAGSKTAPPELAYSIAASPARPNAITTYLATTGKVLKPDCRLTNSPLTHAGFSGYQEIYRQLSPNL